MSEVKERRRAGAMHNIPYRVNLAAWYRYRQGLTNVSGKVSSWGDSSNNSRPLLQATAANRPTLLSDGTVLFDGTDDYLQATFTLAQPFTIYATLQQVTWTSGDIVFDGVTGTTKLTQTASTPELTLDGGTALSASSTIPVAPKWGVFAAVFNGTSGVYQAGGGAAAASVTGDAGAGTAGGFTLGASRAPGSYANIAVREVAIFSVAHDAPTRLQMLRYMQRVGQSLGGV